MNHLDFWCSQKFVNVRISFSLLGSSSARIRPKMCSYEIFADGFADVGELKWPLHSQFRCNIYCNLQGVNPLFLTVSESRAEFDLTVAAQVNC